MHLQIPGHIFEVILTKEAQPQGSSLTSRQTDYQWCNKLHLWLSASVLHLESLADYSLTTTLPFRWMQTGCKQVKLVNANLHGVRTITDHAELAWIENSVRITLSCVLTEHSQPHSLQWISNKQFLEQNQIFILHFTNYYHPAPLKKKGVE